MKQQLQSTIAYGRRLLTRPMSELNRWQFAARYAVGMARYTYQQLNEDRASQMAAALTYRTIFSLVPLLVMSLLVFKAFGGFQSFGGELQSRVYDYLGLDAIEIQETQKEAEQALEEGKPPPPAPEDADPEVAPLGVEPAPADPEMVEGGEDRDPQTPDEQQTKARVDQLLANLQEQVATVDFGSIGLVGLGLLIWAGLSLVVSLETSFNRIYSAPEGRPWHLRITIYWAVITLGPVLVAASLYMSAKLLTTARSVDTFGVFGWVVSVLTPLASTAASWLLLLLMYKLLPNVKVRLKSAIIGAMIAAVLWEVSKWGFRIYVDNFIREGTGYSALYGSIALLPLFLLWVYLTWLIILFGLELSYVSQTIRGTRFLRGRAEESPGPSDGLIPPTAILAVASTLARHFADGQPMHVGEMVRETGLPERAVERFVGAMVQAEFAHQLEGDDDGPGPYSLSRPAERIALRGLLHAGYDTAAADLDPSTRQLLVKLRAAEDQTVGDTQLAELLAPPPGEFEAQGDVEPQADETAASKLPRPT